MYNSKQIKRYFKLAKNVSEFSNYEKNKIGAVLIYKHKIISIGYNKKTSSPIQMKYNKYRSTSEREYDIDKQNNYIHAEIDCVQSSIKHFNGNYSKCSIFIYRTKKDGEKGISKPCKACAKYLEDMGIKNIYYTTNNGWNYERRNYEN